MCADYKVTGCLPRPPSPHHVHSLVPVRIEHTVPVLPHDDYRCNWGGVGRSEHDDPHPPLWETLQVRPKAGQQLQVHKHRKLTRAPGGQQGRK